MNIQYTYNIWLSPNWLNPRQQHWFSQFSNAFILFPILAVNCNNNKKTAVGRASASIAKYTKWREIHCVNWSNVVPIEHNQNKTQLLNLFIQFKSFKTNKHMQINSRPSRRHQFSNNSPEWTNSSPFSSKRAVWLWQNSDQKDFSIDATMFYCFERYLRSFQFDDQTKSNIAHSMLCSCRLTTVTPIEKCTTIETKCPCIMWYYPVAEPDVFCKCKRYGVFVLFLLEIESD